MLNLIDPREGGRMNKSRKKLYEQCRKLLLEKRQEILNNLRSMDSSLTQQFSGDEADMAQVQIEQNSSLVQRERANHLLREVDAALSRIDNETYGICEETEEEIEKERLLAMPWTRLSLTGAEEREARSRKFAM